MSKVSGTQPGDCWLESSSSNRKKIVFDNKRSFSQLIITGAIFNGKPYGRNKTIQFSVCCPVDGDQLRIRFSNRYGTKPYQIGAMNLIVDGISHIITKDGKTSFEIPTGGFGYSDPCSIPISAGSELELRLYFTSYILDNNTIEENARFLPGDHSTISTPKEKFRIPFLASRMGSYQNVLGIEAVEIRTGAPVKAIFAFGDSITALSKWTKPLAKHLEDRFPGEYVLLNSGISGNCLLFESGGPTGAMFGEMACKRFERDVLSVPDLSVVIIGLGERFV